MFIAEVVTTEQLYSVLKVMVMQSLLQNDGK